VKKLTAKPIKERSWIINDAHDRLGVLSDTGTGWVLISNQGVAQYDTVAQLQVALQATVVFEQPQVMEEVAVDNIDKWPIKHNNPQNIQRDGVTTYTKTTSSRTRFAAGYWALRFRDAWSGSLSPKTDTLDAYEHLGPFDSKLEMMTVITQRNRELKNEK
jgi:hypothetical protein